MRVTGFLAALVLVPRVGLAQECETNSDCGHGFQCIHDSAGTSAVTGVGGSTMPVCGDGICEGGSEDIESCPDDCDTIQYCAPGECSSDGDCAEGYECGPEVGSNSGSTSVGGTGGSVCGDGICSFDESNTSCPDDCRVYRLCQVAQVECMADDDCPDGFYCYLDGVVTGSSSGSASSNVEGASGSTDTATNGDDGASTSGGEQIVFIAGVCLPESSDGGTTQGNSSTDAGQVTSVSNGSGGSGTDGAGGAASDSGALNASATGSGEDSDSGGSSSGGASGTGGGDEDESGCACAAVGAPSSASWLAMIGLVGVASALRRRRTVLS